jgi:hypothetical protein
MGSVTEVRSKEEFFEYAGLSFARVAVGQANATPIARARIEDFIALLLGARRDLRSAPQVKFAGRRTS